MTEKSEIKVYKLESFIVIHWRMQNLLTTNTIKIFLDQTELPKPFLVISLNNKLELILIVNAENLTLRSKKYALRIEDAKDNRLIDRSNAKNITQFNEKILAQFTPAIRGKILNALFVNSIEVFKCVDHKIQHALAKKFAQGVSNAYAVSDRQLFIRLPWANPIENCLAQGRLLELTSTDRTDKGNQAILIEQNYFNFFIEQTIGDNNQLPFYYLLSIKDLGTFPFAIKAVKHATVDEVINEMSEKDTQSQAMIAFFKSIAEKKKGVPPPPIIDLAHEFQGKIESIRENCVIGWAVDKKNLPKPFALEVYVDANRCADVAANLAAPKVGLKQDVGNYAFIWPIGEQLLTGELHEISFFYPGSQQQLEGSPLLLGRGYFDCEITLEQGHRLIGWARERITGISNFSLEIRLDNEQIEQRFFETAQTESFSIELPRKVFDSKAHSVQINLLTQEHKIAYTQTRTIRHSYQGLIEHVDFGSLSGWISNDAFPELTVDLDVVINSKYHLKTTAGLVRPDIQIAKKLTTAKVGFHLDIPQESLWDSVCSIELYIAGTDCLVSSNKTLLTPKDIIIRGLISAAENLKAANSTNEPGHKSLSPSLQVTPDASAWVIRQILAPAIKILRESQGIPKSIQLALSTKTQQPCSKHSAIVDIIIPVYQGYNETLQCIDSVLTAKTGIAHEIIIINDQSPDGRLSYKLKSLAKERQLTLIENQQNQGFVVSVNNGMRLHPDRDVLLLNADTVVCDYWLDRLTTAAHQNANIGTVTPFSNNATICSFPQFNTDNELPENVTLAQLDQLFAQENRGKILDLPTAIGFCMYIKRQTLNETGYFDDKTWGKGYGEENDFCLRSAALGWRHVLAADVFVQHHGAISFLTDKNQMLSENLNLLNRRYPDYSATVQRFIHQDPLAPLRNSVIKQILLQTPQSYVLFIMHNLGGGAKSHADELARLLMLQDCPVLELSVKTNGYWELQVLSQSFSLNYRYPQDYPQLLDDLKELGVWRIHYHQTLGFPKKIWELPEQLNLPYDFTAHDFMPICPRINLIDETEGYCGEAQYNAQNCTRCVQINGFGEGVDLHEKYAEFGGSVQNWRQYYQHVLKNAEHVFAPSNSTAAIYRKHFKLKNIRVKLHPEQAFAINHPAATQTGTSPITVAVIGAIGQHKGFNILLACAKNALKQNLPLKFVIIGFTSDNQALEELQNVTITGAYRRAELDGLITQHHCQLALFLSVWPETFCYTLTEAWRNGLYPIAFDMGAIAERIHQVGYGELIPYTTDPVVINQALLDAAGHARVPATVPYPGANYAEILQSYYEIK